MRSYELRFTEELRAYLGKDWTVEHDSYGVSVLHHGKARLSAGLPTRPDRRKPVDARDLRVTVLMLASSASYMQIRVRDDLKAEYSAARDALRSLAVENND